jgi:hypothetical protein
MINHARTLLLNRSGRTYTRGLLGEEYIPEEYIPINVPSYVLTPRRILLGADPDRVFLNFRAWELLSLIHGTELEEFVYELDPRVTYWPQQQTDFFLKTSNAISLKKVSGYSRTRAYLHGQLSPDNSVGRAYAEYFVQITQNGDALKAEISAETDYSATVTPIQFMSETSVFSQQIPLPDNQLSIQFSDIAPDAYEFLLMEEHANELLTQNYEALTLEDGDVLEFNFPPPVRQKITAGAEVLAQWQLQAYTRPTSAIKICLPKLEVLGEPLFLELFGVRNDVEPYATFKNIWFDHPMPNYRLAAFVLAMIYRTNEAGRR